MDLMSATMGDEEGHQRKRRRASATPPDEFVDEEAPEAVMDLFKSATVQSIIDYNTKLGIADAPSATSDYLRPNMAFSITFASASWPSRVFEQTASVLRRGGTSGAQDIGFTIVMFRGEPHLAIDVLDATMTTLSSHRLRVNVRIHPQFVSSHEYFPQLAVSDKSIVRKCAAKQYHVMLWYQLLDQPEQMHIIKSLSDSSGPVHHDTLRLSQSEWEKQFLQNCVHTFTVNIEAGQLADMCRIADEEFRLAIYAEHDVMAHEGGTNDISFVVEAENSEKEVSHFVKPVRVEPSQKEGSITLHVTDCDEMAPLDVVNALSNTSKLRYEQSFDVKQLASFLQHIEKNRGVTLRMGKDQLLIVSHAHGQHALSQLVVSPKSES